MEFVVTEAVSIKNHRINRNGFSPAQYPAATLRRLTPLPAWDTQARLGIHQEILDGESMMVRGAARESFAQAPHTLLPSQKERPYTWTFRHGRPRLLLQAPGITPTMEVVWTAAYVLQDNKSGLQAIVIAHVDDLLWSGTQAMDKVMDEIIKEFKFGAIEFGDKFDYCGRTVEQSRDGTTVNCPNTAAKVRAIYLDPERRERNQLRSVVGSLNWLVRVCRIDIAYEVHRLQAVMQKALVEDLMPHKGMRFKYEAFDIHDMTIYSITDASVGADYDISKKGEPMGNRSQSGRLLLLGPSNLEHAGQGTVHVLEYHSSVIRRVCRSTLQAETLSVISGYEGAEHLRAVL